MICPNCKLLNPDTAQRCDCGYDFITKLDIPEPEEFRWLIDLPRPRQVIKKPDPVPVGVFLALLGLVLILSNLRGEDAVYGLVALGVVIFIILRILDRGNNLLANGNLTFGKVVGVEREDGDDEISWRVDYQFRDSRGTVHTAAYEYAYGEWQGQVGDVLPVFYDSSNPSRNYLLLDSDRIVPPSGG